MRKKSIVYGLIHRQCGFYVFSRSHHLPVSPARITVGQNLPRQLQFRVKMQVPRHWYSDPFLPPIRNRLTLTSWIFAPTAAMVHHEDGGRLNL